MRRKFMCSWGSNRQRVWVWAQGKERWGMLGKIQVDTEWSRLVEVERHRSRGGDGWVMLMSGCWSVVLPN